jgi:hypothetical protein
MQFLKPRHQYMVVRLQDSFGVEEEEAKGAIRKAWTRVGEFLAGVGSAHLLAYHQPRDTRTVVSARGFRGECAVPM